MQDWQIPFIGLLGAIIGILATAFWNWRERKERFKVMSFEKRLEAHQLAFYWNQTIYHSLSSRDPEQISKCIREAQEWWNSNCLLLDKKSQKSFISVFNSGNRYSRNIRRPGSEPEAERIWDDLNTNLADIIKGIGAEHLQRIDDGNIEEERQGRNRVITDNTGKNNLIDRLKPWWLRKWHFVKTAAGFNTVVLVLFTIAYVVAVGLIFAISILFYLDNKLTYTGMISYLFLGSAATLFSIASIWSAQKRWVIRILIIAVLMVIVGMLADLFNQVELFRMVSAITE